MGSYSQSHITSWWHDFARLRDKLKPLYLHYHSAHGHQTWQYGDLPRGAPNHKVAQRSDHVVLQSHVTKRKLLYFHSYIAYDQQTWQDGNLPWRAPSHGF